MRRLLLLGPMLYVGACGGKAAPTEKPVTEVSAKPLTRVPVEEPSEEEGVTIVNARGHMELSVIEAGLSPHNEELTDCYMSKLNKRRWLGGHVVLTWDIKKDGTVTQVKLAESDLGAWPIEKCLLEVARSATFGKPVGGDADFSVPLDFTAKGKLISWEEDKGLKAVGGQTVKLDACAKGKVPAPSDVTVTVYVGPAGKAQSVGFASAKSPIDDAWGDCAEKAALGWRLPDPKGIVAKLAIKYRTH
ncbi:MAG: AgmX/PglI C-terminal domain-containing protein [Myxococcales bacterium]|nr:AgmX/PglI C-terminal domain-containing protein [Myxococcales bacterium]